MFKKQKKKQELEGYNTRPDQKFGWKLIVPIFVLILFGLVLFLYPYYSKNKETKKAGSNVTCGDIVLENDAEKAALPFIARIKAKVGGQYDTSMESCELIFNGQVSGKNKPVNGECRFANLKIILAGSYEIGYTMKGLNGKTCTKENNYQIGPKKVPSTDTEEEPGI